MPNPPATIMVMCGNVIPPMRCSDEFRKACEKYPRASKFLCKAFAQQLDKWVIDGWLGVPEYVKGD